MEIIFVISVIAYARAKVKRPAKKQGAFLPYLLLERARRTVFLCDSTKFDTTALYTLAPLDRIDFAVFDAPFKELETRTTVL